MGGRVLDQDYFYRMIRFLKIIFLLLLFSSCSHKPDLDGLWYSTYALHEGEPDLFLQPILLDIDNDNLSVVHIRDLSDGDMGKIKIDSSKFEWINNTLNSEILNAKIEYTRDSLILTNLIDSLTLVFKRIDPCFAKVSFNKKDLRGSYSILTPYKRDSVCFLNDSVLIYTGKYQEYLPVEKWEIVNYKGFKFFNIHYARKPLTLIKSSIHKKTEMYHPFMKGYNIDFAYIKTDSQKERLYGNWVECLNLNEREILPPNCTPEDALYKIRISSESIVLKKHHNKISLNWELTPEGKRIYFADRIFKKDGSWKICSLTDTTMTLIICQFGLSPEIVKFKKIPGAQLY